MWNEVRHRSQRLDVRCDCLLRTSHGVLCKCRIMEYHSNGDAIDPVEIDVFWRSLYMDGSNRPSKDERQATADYLLDEAVRMFKERKSEYEVKRLAARLRQETYPEFEEYESPPCPPRKGRPPKASGSRIKSNLEKGYKNLKKQAGKFKEKMNDKTSKGNDKRREEAGKKTWNKIPGWILKGHMPHEVRSYLTGYFDVIGDDQCGYRCLSWFIFSGDQDKYLEIRWQLQAEMTVNSDYWYDYYEEMPGDYDRVWRALNYHEEGRCDSYYHLDAYLMLPLAATTFRKIIVLYSQEQPLTFMPLRYAYDEDVVIQPTVPELPEIWNMGYIQGGVGHFIALNAPDDAPKPMLHPNFRLKAEDHIKPWANELNIWDTRFNPY